MWHFGAHRPSKSEREYFRLTNMNCRLFLRLRWVPVLLLSLFAFLNSADPDLRRDETVRAVEKVLPCVVNISSKTVVQRRGFFFNWWRDYWSPFAEEMPPQFSVGSGV